MADEERDLPSPDPTRTRPRAAARDQDSAPASLAKPTASRSAKARRPATAERGEDVPASPAAPAQPRAARAVNQVSPAPERGRGARKSAEERAAPEAGGPGGPSHRPGDVPPSLAGRYFTEALRGGATVAFYEGPGAKTVAFHDHGSRLATEQSHPAVARDLAAIASHRGWRAIQVKGSDEFRREIWIEARTLGLEVKGYKPRERDQQELDRRLEASLAKARPAPRPSREARAPEQPLAPQPAPERGKGRPDFEAGVAGVLLASGEAPYRRRTGEPLTPFIRIDRGDARALDVWGAGLPEALRRSGAQVGDAVQVRRDGVDVIQRTVDVRDPRTGVSSPQLREVSRHRWVIEAERFRRASPSEAARDAELRGAQSHLAVLNTVIDRSVKDPERRERLRAEAREIVAGELAQGRRFTPARIREIEPVLARDVAQAHSRDAAPERVHRR